MAAKPKKILIATVGGSCAPIVRSIQDHKPDFVLFVCSLGQHNGDMPPCSTMPRDGDVPHAPSIGRRGTSPLVDGEGDVCDHETEPVRRKSIVAQAGLARERYEKIEVSAIDSVQECSRAVTTAYTKALTRNRQAAIIADYTGGTKTMTAALVRAATGVYASCSELWVVTGERSDLHSVRDGTEVATPQNVVPLILEDRWQEALRLANHFRYRAACDLLIEITRDGSLVESLAVKTRRLLQVCRGLDAWDRFEFEEALQLLQQGEPEPAAAVVAPLLHTIRDLVATQNARPHSTTAGTGQARRHWSSMAMLPVYDLLNNARRRKTQGRYDDGIVRLNRMLEMLAQNRLWFKHGIDSEDVDPTMVPRLWLEKLHMHNGKRHTRGLKDDYGLLSALDDRLGDLFRTYDHELSEKVVEVRNKSYLVHAVWPISEAMYLTADAIVQQFMERVVLEIVPRFDPPKQFPTRLQPMQFA